jgi:hypothetical protein
MPSITCIRVASKSDACGGNEACSARRLTLRPPCAERRSGGDDLGSKQTWRFEHKGISATSKRFRRKVVYAGKKLEADPIYSWGRPMTRRKKQVNALRGTAGVGDQTSEERYADNNVGKVPGAAGPGKHLQRLLERGQKPKQRRVQWDWRVSPYEQ